MDAKSRDLALLSFLSLSCAVSAWAGIETFLARCFLPSVQSQCSARPMGGGAEMDQLLLKRAAASRLSGKWSEDDYDLLAAGIVVGRIMKAAAAPDRTPTHGYGPTREAAMAAFAKSRCRE